jgi:hypothetical protein
MVPTKSKSDTDRPWSLRSDLPASQRSDSVRLYVTRSGAKPPRFCRHHGADKIKVGHRYEDRICQWVKGQTVSDFMSRGRGEAAHQFCRIRKSISRTLTDHGPSDRICLRVKGQMTLSDFMLRRRASNPTTSARRVSTDSALSHPLRKKPYCRRQPRLWGAPQL